MKNRIFGYIINLTLFAGYCVFCWYYCSIQPGYVSMNAVLEALKFAAIFLAALALAALCHQSGHIIFAVWGGFKLKYLELLFIKLWNDGGKLRAGFVLNAGIMTCGRAEITVKNAFGTREAFSKNRAKYERFILGGFIFNAIGLICGIIVCAVCLSYHNVYSLLCIAALAFIVSNWFCIYAAFTEEGFACGDFLIFAVSRDTERLVTSLAAKSATESLDHSFLFCEAQNAVALKCENGLPWADADSISALSEIVLFAAAKKARFDPCIENYLNNEIFVPEGLNSLPPQKRKLFLLRIQNFIGYYLINYGQDRAKEILDLAKKACDEMKLRDKLLKKYFENAGTTLEKYESGQKQKGLFLSSKYTGGFTCYREITDLAEGIR